MREKQMAENFKLTPPGPSETNARFASELLIHIQAEQTRFRQTRPVLISWAMRMPVGIHRQLSRAAKKHGVSMTDIIIVGLRKVLPVLLSEDELRAAADSAGQET